MRKARLMSAALFPLETIMGRAITWWCSRRIFGARSYAMRKVFERTALIFSFVLLCIVPFLEAAPIIGQWIKPLSVIAISLAALVGFELARYFDVSEYREDNRKLMNLVDRVERSMGCNASLVKLPREV